MIVALESLRLAFASLRANPLRSILTILGIVIGIGAVVALMSIGAGSQRAVEEQFTTFGTDTVTVSTSRFASDDAALDEDDLAAINEVPGVRRTVCTVEADASVSFGSTTTFATITGTTPAIQSMNSLELQAGSFFSWFAAENDLPLAVLGNTIVENLDADVDQIVGQTVRIGGRDFEVVGVLAETGDVGFASADSSIIVPLGVIEGRLVAFDPAISEIRVQAEPSAVDTYVDALTAALRGVRDIDAGEDDDFQVRDASSIASAVSQTSVTLTRLMAAIAAISLVVGGIGIANVMLVTVRERTREIGVRRAVGATRHDIVVQFLVDAVVISVIGGVLGVGAGIAAAFLGGSLMDVAPAFSWAAVALALVVSAVVGVLAGVGPAVQAASVEPTTALRYE
ncbi:MAG: FtsX-like permease family protein [Actinobacteria bacterium]|nr:FtsX-like permease family protein [Actinomycetota bacterium]